MNMTASFLRVACLILPMCVAVFDLGCQTVQLSEEKAKDLVFQHLQQKGSNVLALSKDDLIPRIELLDLDGDGDSTHILTYQPYKMDEFGNVDYENIQEVIYMTEDDQLVPVFSRKSNMPLEFSNYKPITMENRRIVFHWDNPPGGSSGNQPLNNLSAYSFENDSLTLLKLDDVLSDLWNGYIEFKNDNIVIVKDENMRKSYTLELTDNSISAIKID